MNLSTLSEVSLTVSHEVKPLQKNQNSDSLNRTKKCLTGPPSNNKKRKRNILVLSISLSIADSTFSEEIGQKMCCFGSLLTFQWFMILKNIQKPTELLKYLVDWLNMMPQIKLWYHINKSPEGVACFAYLSWLFGRISQSYDVSFFSFFEKEHLILHTARRLLCKNVWKESFLFCPFCRCLKNVCNTCVTSSWAADSLFD